MPFSFINAKHCVFTKLVTCFISFTFLFTMIVPPSNAQLLLSLPVPGTMLTPSMAYSPALVAGMTIHPENPLRLDFHITSGDDALAGDEFKKESQKLINYFLATLTVPEDEMWVNLSPYEENRIIADGLSKTEMGQDMLIQDYMLKQFTASLMYPEEELGEEFWSRVYERSQETLGTTDIPANTFNKVWIVPEQAVIYVNGSNVFVSESHLKVMLEEDYLALDSNKDSTKHGMGTMTQDDIDIMSDEAKEVVREVIIPEIEREVNEGKTFANLRQIYHSMILATWYKKNLQESILGEAYMDQNKVKGIDLAEKEIKQIIFDQYVEAFKKGVYDYVKEDYDPISQEVVSRKYFSGGLKNIKANNIAVNTTRLNPDAAMLKDGDVKTVAFGMNLMNTGSVVAASPISNLMKRMHGVAPQNINAIEVNGKVFIVSEAGGSKTAFQFEGDGANKMLQGQEAALTIAIADAYKSNSLLELKKVLNKPGIVYRSQDDKGNMFYHTVTDSGIETTPIDAAMMTKGDDGNVDTEIADIVRGEDAKKRNLNEVDVEVDLFGYDFDGVMRVVAIGSDGMNREYEVLEGMAREVSEGFGGLAYSLNEAFGDNLVEGVETVDVNGKTYYSAYGENSTSFDFAIEDGLLGMIPFGSEALAFSIRKAHGGNNIKGMLQTTFKGLKAFISYGKKVYQYALVEDDIVLVPSEDAIIANTIEGVHKGVPFASISASERNSNQVIRSEDIEGNVFEHTLVDSDEGIVTKKIDQAMLMNLSEAAKTRATLREKEPILRLFVEINGGLREAEKALRELKINFPEESSFENDAEYREAVKKQRTEIRKLRAQRTRMNTRRDYLDRQLNQIDVKYFGEVQSDGAMLVDARGLNTANDVLIEKNRLLEKLAVAKQELEVAESSHYDLTAESPLDKQYLDKAGRLKAQREYTKAFRASKANRDSKQRIVDGLQSQIDQIDQEQKDDAMLVRDVAGVKQALRSANELQALLKTPEAEKELFGEAGVLSFIQSKIRMDRHPQRSMSEIIKGLNSVFFESNGITVFDENDPSIVEYQSVSEGEVVAAKLLGSELFRLDAINSPSGERLLNDTIMTLVDKETFFNNLASHVIGRYADDEMNAEFLPSTIVNMRVNAQRAVESLRSIEGANLVQRILNRGEHLWNDYIKNKISKQKYAFKMLNYANEVMNDDYNLKAFTHDSTMSFKFETDVLSWFGFRLKSIPEEGPYYDYSYESGVMLGIAKEMANRISDRYALETLPVDLAMMNVRDVVGVSQALRGAVELENLLQYKAGEEEIFGEGGIVVFLNDMVKKHEAFGNVLVELLKEINTKFVQATGTTVFTSADRDLSHFNEEAQSLELLGIEVAKYDTATNNTDITLKDSTALRSKLADFVRQKYMDNEVNEESLPSVVDEIRRGARVAMIDLRHDRNQIMSQILKPITWDTLLRKSDDQIIADVRNAVNEYFVNSRFNYFSAISADSVSAITFDGDQFSLFGEPILGRADKNNVHPLENVNYERIEKSLSQYISNRYALESLPVDRAMLDTDSRGYKEVITSFEQLAKDLTNYGEFINIKEHLKHVAQREISGFDTGDFMLVLADRINKSIISKYGVSPFNYADYQLEARGDEVFWFGTKIAKMFREPETTSQYQIRTSALDGQMILEDIENYDDMFSRLADYLDLQLRTEALKVVMNERLEGSVTKILNRIVFHGGAFVPAVVMKMQQWKPMYSQGTEPLFAKFITDRADDIILEVNNLDSKNFMLNMLSDVDESGVQLVDNKFVWFDVPIFEKTEDGSIKSSVLNKEDYANITRSLVKYIGYKFSIVTRDFEDDRAMLTQFDALSEGATTYYNALVDVAKGLREDSRIIDVDASLAQISQYKYGGANGVNNFMEVFANLLETTIFRQFGVSGFNYEDFGLTTDSNNFVYMFGEKIAQVQRDVDNLENDGTISLVVIDSHEAISNRMADYLDEQFDLENRYTGALSSRLQLGLEQILYDLSGGEGVGYGMFRIVMMINQNIDRWNSILKNRGEQEFRSELLFNINDSLRKASDFFSRGFGIRMFEDDGIADVKLVDNQFTWFDTPIFQLVSDTAIEPINISKEGLEDLRLTISLYIRDRFGIGSDDLIADSFEGEYDDAMLVMSERVSKEDRFAEFMYEFHKAVNEDGAARVSGDNRFTLGEVFTDGLIADINFGEGPIFSRTSKTEYMVTVPFAGTYLINMLEGGLRPQFSIENLSDPAMLDRKRDVVDADVFMRSGGILENRINAAKENADINNEPFRVYLYGYGSIVVLPEDGPEKAISYVRNLVRDRMPNAINENSFEFHSPNRLLQEFGSNDVIIEAIDAAMLESALEVKRDVVSYAELFSIGKFDEVMQVSRDRSKEQGEAFTVYLFGYGSVNVGVEDSLEESMNVIRQLAETKVLNGESKSYQFLTPADIVGGYLYGENDIIIEVVDAAMMVDLQTLNENALMNYMQEARNNAIAMKAPLRIHIGNDFMREFPINANITGIYNLIKTNINNREGSEEKQYELVNGNYLDYSYSGNDLVIRINDAAMIGEELETKAGMSFIFGTGANGQAVDRTGVLYTDDNALTELGHNILLRAVNNEWVFTGKQMRGDKPSFENGLRAEGDLSFEDLFSGPNLAKRFAASDDAVDFVSRNIDSNDLPEGVTSAQDMITLLRKTNLTNAEITQFAQSIDTLLVGLSKAAVENDEVAVNYVKANGQEIGRALAALMKEYINEDWVENFVLVSGVGENFAREAGKVGENDILIGSIRNGLRDALKQQGVPGQRINTIANGVERSSISWEREISAARITDMEVEYLGLKEEDASDVKSIGISLGGTKIGAGLLSRVGDIMVSPDAILWKQNEGFNDGTSEGIVRGIVAQIVNTIDQYAGDITEVKKIGIAFAGPVNRETGFVGTPFPAPNLPFNNYDLRGQIKSDLQIAFGEKLSSDLIVDIYNDAAAAVLGEVSPRGRLAEVVDAAMMSYEDAYEMFTQKMKENAPIESLPLRPAVTIMNELDKEDGEGRQVTVNAALRVAIAAENTPKIVSRKVLQSMQEFFTGRAIQASDVFELESEFNIMVTMIESVAKTSYALEELNLIEFASSSEALLGAIDKEFNASQFALTNGSISDLGSQRNQIVARLEGDITNEQLEEIVESLERIQKTTDAMIENKEEDQFTAAHASVLRSQIVSDVRKIQRALILRSSEEDEGAEAKYEEALAKARDHNKEDQMNELSIEEVWTVANRLETDDSAAVPFLSVALRVVDDIRDDNRATSVTVLERLEDMLEGTAMHFKETIELEDSSKWFSEANDGARVLRGVIEEMKRAEEDNKDAAMIVDFKTLNESALMNYMQEARNNAIAMKAPLRIHIGNDFMREFPINANIIGIYNLIKTNINNREGSEEKQYELVNGNFLDYSYSGNDLVIRIKDAAMMDVKEARQIATTLQQEVDDATAEELQGVLEKLPLDAALSIVNQLEDNIMAPVYFSALWVVASNVNKYPTNISKVVLERARDRLKQRALDSDQKIFDARTDILTIQEKLDARNWNLANQGVDLMNQAIDSFDENKTGTDGAMLDSLGLRSIPGYISEAFQHSYRIAVEHNTGNFRKELPLDIALRVANALEENESAPVPFTSSIRIADALIENPNLEISPTILRRLNDRMEGIMLLARNGFYNETDLINSVKAQEASDTFKRALSKDSQYQMGTVPELTTEDTAKKGGIDFNSAEMTMTETGDKVDFQFDNTALDGIEMDAVEGILPIIINITPITNFVPLIGYDVNQEEEVQQLSML